MVSFLNVYLLPYQQLTCSDAEDILKGILLIIAPNRIIDVVKKKPDLSFSSKLK